MSLGKSFTGENACGYYSINKAENAHTDAASNVGGGGAGVAVMVGPVDTELTMGSCDHGDLGAGGGMLVSGSVVAVVPSWPKFK